VFLNVEYGNNLVEYQLYGKKEAFLFYVCSSLQISLETSFVLISNWENLIVS